VSASSSQPDYPDWLPENYRTVGKGLPDPVTAAANKVPGGAMVAWYPPGWQQRDLAITEEPDQVHLTLVYLGKLADLSASQQAGIVDAVRNIASSTQPFRALDSGTGFFNTDDGVATVALADAPELEELQERLVHALEGVVDLPNTHSFTPHITLGYGPKAKTEALARRSHTFGVGALTIAFGPELIRVPLAGGIELAIEEFGDAPGHPFRGNQYSEFESLDVEIHQNPAGIVIIDKLVVPETERSQGKGSAFMSDLTQWADTNQKTLALTPSKDYGATSVSRLEEFYKGFGFVKNVGRKADQSISESMRREPVQLRAGK
jgi:2'-5' RNA ligase